MFKALLKKQFMELGAFLTNDRKTGSRRSPKATVGFTVFFGGILLLMMFSFGTMAWPLAQAMIPIEQGWLYFLSMELMTLLMAVIMGAFAGYSGLFAAKDNELLLAMPIPPWMILVVRLLILLTTNFMCVLLAWVPTVFVYTLYAEKTLGAVLSALPMAVFLAGISAVLSAIIGWVVAEVSGRVRNKNAVVVVLSLVFMGGYFIGVQKLQSTLQGLLRELSDDTDARAKADLLYHLGHAAEGDGLALLVFGVVVLVAMTVFCGVLGRQYFRLMTTKRSAKKTIYHAKMTQKSSLRKALLRRELLHLASSPAYLLNCALGSVMLVVAGVVMLIKAGKLCTQASELLPADILPLLLCAMVCVGLATNSLAAPSVSLEGKTLWLIQSLPVTAWQALRAKLDLHLLLTAVPAAFCALCGGLAFRLNLMELLLILLVVLLFSCFTALFDLMAGLLWPKLHWTNETAVVKQSLFSAVAIFGGWAAGLLLSVGGFLLAAVLPVAAGLLLCVAVLILEDVMLLNWVKGKGCRRFETL